MKLLTLDPELLLEGARFEPPLPFTVASLGLTFPVDLRVEVE